MMHRWMTPMDAAAATRAATAPAAALAGAGQDGFRPVTPEVKLPLSARVRGGDGTVQSRRLRAAS